MSELEEFLAEVVPRHQKAVDALHNADTELWREHWSTADPVTLFGGVLPSKVGWEAVRDGFESVARRFKEGSGARLEVLAAEVSGDLGYLVAHEHSLGSFDGGPVVENTLRVTQIYRREGGAWKLVHRHGNSPPA